jgi:hypothetical protein
MGPYIAVDPVCQKDKIQFSGWQLTKGLESWSWSGCDGSRAKVLVFARGAEAELLINGNIPLSGGGITCIGDGCFRRTARQRLICGRHIQFHSLKNNSIIHCTAQERRIVQWISSRI